MDLHAIWFVLLGLLLTGYAVLDGFDLGVGILHPLAKNDHERRLFINAIGPIWDGNEVWLVIGGGALFAGFPVVYATIFSALYELFMVFLVMLIFRAISIEFRSKESMLWWRKLWDICYCTSSVLLALSLGLVLGNVIQGLAIDQNYTYQGTLLDLFNPYSLLISVTALALFMMHGAIYLVMKTENRLYAKLTILVKNTTIFFVLMFSLTSVATLLYIPHMVARYKEVPYMFAFPVLAILAVANITRQISRRKYFFAFLSSAFVAAMPVSIHI